MIDEHNKKPKKVIRWFILNLVLIAIGSVVAFLMAYDQGMSKAWAGSKSYSDKTVLILFGILGMFSFGFSSCIVIRSKRYLLFSFSLLASLVFAAFLTLLGIIMIKG